MSEERAPYVHEGKPVVPDIKFVRVAKVNGAGPYRGNMALVVTRANGALGGMEMSIDVARELVATCERFLREHG